MTISIRTPYSKTGYKNNLGILELRYPKLINRLQEEKKLDISLESIVTSNGFINIQIGIKGKIPLWLYDNEASMRDPKGIIADWRYEPHDVLFILGMGAGYLPLATQKKVGTKPRIVIIEPCMEMFKIALHNNDLQALISDRRVDFFVGEDIKISDIIKRYKSFIPIGRNSVVTHPKYDIIFGAKLNALKQELTERIRAERDIWFTTKKYGKQMFQNAVSNLASLFSSIPMKAIREKFTGIPAICIAAGPTLEKALPHLKALKEKALLIACDSSVNSILKAGISPHIVVTTDIFKHNLEKLRAHVNQLRNSMLIFGMESNPDNVRFYLGQRRVAITAYNKLVLNYMDPMWDLQCKLPPMTSVSHLAVFSAMALGADPIVLVGMDMAYVEGHSHASGSVFYHTPDLQRTIKTPGTKGFQVSSSPQFVADKLILENAIAESSARIINTSFDGAYLNGARIYSISELVSTELQKTHNFEDCFDSTTWPSAIDNTRLVKDILKVVDEIENFKFSCEKNEKEIQALIKNYDDETQSSTNAALFTEVENKFSETRKKEHDCINMLEDVMLADIQEITKKQELLEVNRYVKDTDKFRDKLNVMQNWIDAYKKAADFYLGQLSHVQDYIMALLELKKSEDCESLDHHLALARFFKNNKELWQSVLEYETCMQIDPDNHDIYTELYHLYVESNLWHSACQLVTKAGGLFKDQSEVKKLMDDANHHIEGIMASIKDKWVQGDRDTTRKLLNEYLLLCADDPQANELKEVLNELDLELSASWNSKGRKEDKARTLQQRMEPASQCLGNMQFERAIGMLEGIINDFPGILFDIREKIGDCRMLQGDYKSALWNYTQASKGKLQIKEIMGKIAGAKQNMISAD